MDGGGFEPPKQDAADLQSVPFGHSGIHPYARYHTPFLFNCQVVIISKQYFFVGLQYMCYN